MTAETAPTPKRPPAALIGLGVLVAVAFAGVIGVTVGCEAGFGVAAGFLTAGLPSLLPIVSAFRGQPVVIPAMAAMGLRMVLALVVAGCVLVTQGREVLEPFAAGLCVAYVVTLFAETALLARLVSEGGGVSPFQLLNPETDR